MLNQTRDVKTGRLTKYHMDFMRRAVPKAHVGEAAWWQVSTLEHSPSKVDGHTFEVCLFNMGTHHSVPTWPVLGFFNEADALAWTKKLITFARTIDAVTHLRKHDEQYNGDARLGKWLEENGFHKVNHIWWTL